jgi:hypothetical protein
VELIIEHAKEQLAAGTPPIETLHRRGSLVETITELEFAAQLIVLGKRGEHADFASLHLGSNLERVVRAAHRPVLSARPRSRMFAALSLPTMAGQARPRRLNMWLARRYSGSADSWCRRTSGRASRKP